MLYLRSLPLSLLLLISDYATPSQAKPSFIQKAHQFASDHTHNLARDLRIAFGGPLPIIHRRDQVASDESGLKQKHVVYCRPKQSGLGGTANTSPAAGNGTAVSGRPTPSSASVTGTRSSQSGRPSATSNIPSSPWRLAQDYSGNSFFDGWDFFLGGDPTNGIVNYVDQNTARSNGLLGVNDQGNAIMKVETSPTVDNLRQSIRITTKFQFNGGLVIMDAVHMPTGCGTWPAFWTNGPNWPHGGEIDIVEGVHDYTNNQATIHTDVGCTIASTSQNVLAISGNVIGGTDCAALTTGNQGCGIRASTSNSFGSGFNANGGGVYAMKWDATGIATYFFPRGSIPADIDAGRPQPDAWGPALARWPAASCDPFKFFNNHHAIFDTTLCGDWAGGVWNSAGLPGQEQSCAQRTGFPTCEAFVRAKGSAFNDAYWEVKSVKIYQLQN